MAPPSSSPPTNVHSVWQLLADVGIDMNEVASRLEDDGVSSFQAAFQELIAALAAKAADR